MAFIDHDLVAGTGKLIVVLHAVLGCPVAGELHDICLLDVGRRSVVIGNNDDLIGIPDLGAHLFQVVSYLNAGAEDIVHHGFIDIDPDNVSGMNFRAGRGFRQYFFTNCHSHKSNSLLKQKG